GAGRYAVELDLDLRRNLLPLRAAVIDAGKEGRPFFGVGIARVAVILRLRVPDADVAGRTAIPPVQNGFTALQRPDARRGDCHFLRSHLAVKCQRQAFVVTVWDFRSVDGGRP